MAPLRAVEWVQKLVAKMKADAANGPEDSQDTQTGKYSLERGNGMKIRRYRSLFSVLLAIGAVV
jgi:hypothetical protein